MRADGAPSETISVRIGVRGRPDGLTLFFVDPYLLLLRASEWRNGICRSTLLSVTTSQLDNGTPMPAFQFVKALGVHMSNTISTCVQCTNAANKARQLISMIWRSSQDLSQLVFITIIWGTSTSTSRVQYTGVSVKPNWSESKD